MNAVSVPLLELCHPKQWKTLSSEQLTDAGFPVYGANGRIGYYTEFTHAEPTLMITCRGATCGTLNVSVPKSYISGNAMALDNLDKRRVDQNYLFHCLQHRGFKDAITGAAQPQITRQNLARVEIPLPPLDEQRRIAAILDKADALRRKRKRALDLLDTLTQSIFLEMFGDPVRNPFKFSLERFGDIGSLERGISKHRPRNDPALLGGDHPLIQTGDVANSGGYIRAFSSTYSDLGLKQSQKWPAGTLCITIAANIAETGILTFPACFPDSVVGFSHPNADLVEYVRVWLSFLQSTLERSAPSVAQKNINLQILREQAIMIPPAEALKTFGLRLHAQRSLGNRLSESASVTSKLLAALQHHAFSGEL